MSSFVQICMVNENLEVVYHSYVKPESRIVDYLTRYSGITAEHLVNVNTRLVLVYPIPFWKKMSSLEVGYFFSGFYSLNWWIKYLGPGNNETFILKVSKRMKNSAYKCPIFPPVLQNHFPPSHTSAGGRLILHIICSWAPSSTIVGNVEFVHS